MQPSQRKFGAKRRATTKTGRAPELVAATPERKAKGLLKDPLATLAGLGLITEEEHRAGVEFALLRSRIYGSERPKGISFEPMLTPLPWGRSTGVGLDPTRDDRDAQDERRYDHAKSALQKCGPECTRIFQQVAINLEPIKASELALLRKALGVIAHHIW